MHEVLSDERSCLKLWSWPPDVGPDIAGVEGDGFLQEILGLRLDAAHPGVEERTPEARRRLRTARCSGRSYCTRTAPQLGGGLGLRDLFGRTSTHTGVSRNEALRQRWAVRVLLTYAHLSFGVHPREWTGSGCGFDHLPGVLLFEPDGAPISERGVEPLAVVDLVDEARQ